MTKHYFYGTIRYEGAVVGDTVRFVNPPKPGVPGAIMKPRNRGEVNGMLRRVKGDLGYIELLPQLNLTPTASGDAGSASRIVVNFPVSSGGTLKIS